MSIKIGHDFDYIVRKAGAARSSHNTAKANNSSQNVSFANELSSSIAALGGGVGNSALYSSLTGIYSELYSGIYSGLYPGFYPGLYSGIYPGLNYSVLSASIRDSLNQTPEMKPAAVPPKSEVVKVNKKSNIRVSFTGGKMT